MSKIHTLFFRQQDGTIFQKLNVIGQLFNSYILCKANKSLYIIDQHAADEKVHYEKMKRDYFSKSHIEMQELISPIVIEVNNSRSKNILLQNLERINKFGFKIKFIPKVTFIVRSVPTFSYRRVVPSVIRKIKDILIDIENQRITEENVLQLCACHSSIHANTKLSRMEMYKLIDQLSGLRNPWVCPHGRPIIKKLLMNSNSVISKKEIDKQFKRF